MERSEGEKGKRKEGREREREGREREREGKEREREGREREREGTKVKRESQKLQYNLCGYVCTWPTSPCDLSLVLESINCRTFR